MQVYLLTSSHVWTCHCVQLSLSYTIGWQHRRYYLSSYPHAYNHHCSDVVYWRYGSNTMHLWKQGIVHSTLCHRCAVCRHFMYDDKVRRCGATWWIRRKFMTIWCPERPSRWHCERQAPQGSLRKHDVITKPEVRNVLQCHQNRTEPRLQITCTENFV